MDAVMEASCPICLLADELPSMVPIEIPHAMLQNMRHVVLCRLCAYAIEDAVAGTREPSPAEMKPEEPAAAAHPREDLERPLAKEPSDEA